MKCLSSIYQLSLCIEPVANGAVHGMDGMVVREGGMGRQDSTVLLSNFDESSRPAFAF